MNRQKQLSQIASTIEENSLYFKNKEKFSDIFPDIQIIFENKKINSKSFQKWGNIKITLNQIKHLSKLANPFYLGYGNPNSKILILGQEKAFDIIYNPDLLFHESMANPFQWNELNDTSWGEKSNLDFDPRFPIKYFNYSYENEKSKRYWARTWYKYSLLISSIYSESTPKEMYFEKENISKSFFNYCFCSEVNDSPKKNTSNVNTLVERLKLTPKLYKFYQSFPVVLLAIGKSVQGNPLDFINSVFGKTEELDYLEIGIKEDNELPICPRLYQSENGQKIILCSQMSGNSRWKNEHFKLLGEKIKGYLK